MQFVTKASTAISEGAAQVSEAVSTAGSTLTTELAAGGRYDDAPDGYFPLCARCVSFVERYAHPLAVVVNHAGAPF